MPEATKGLSLADSGQLDFLGPCPSCSLVSAALTAHTPAFQGTVEAEAATYAPEQLCQGWATRGSFFPWDLADVRFPFYPGFSA